VRRAAPSATRSRPLRSRASTISSIDPSKPPPETALARILYHVAGGLLRAETVAAWRPRDDVVQLGESATFSAAADAHPTLLRRRRSHARRGRLPLAAQAPRTADARRAARSERLERRALHTRPRRESVRPRHERRAAQ